MGTILNAMEEVLNLFASSQETAASHQKNSLLLRKVYRKCSLEQFWEAFSHPVNIILETDFKQKNPYVERLTEFIGIFCAALKRIQSEEEQNFTEEPLITKLLQHLFQASQCTSDIIRFRSCQLINKILDYLVGFDISDDLYTEMQEGLMDRLSDPKGLIRLQAIVSLCRLQDPTDPADPLISQFIELMSHDSQAKVRKLCVEKIACRLDVLKEIVKRTRDIDVNVRLAAFKRLSKFAKPLKIAVRRVVLCTGIFDTSEKVKDYLFSEFLTCWLETYNNDILQLMKSLRLDADEEDIALSAKLYKHVLNEFYFKTRNFKELCNVLPLNDEKLLPYEKLNWETITYWKLFIMLLTKNANMESYLESVVPEVVFFCQYIKGYSEYRIEGTDESYLEKQYTIKQLFHIIRARDLSDTHTIGNLRTLVIFMLKKEDLMDDTVETIISTLAQIMPNTENRCRLGMEIISDILYPIDAEEESQKAKEKEFQLTKLKVRLVTLQHDQENAIAATDFLEAEKLKQEIQDVMFQVNNMKNSIYAPPAEELEKKTDIPTICKCLDIAWAILRCANVSKLTPSLKTLKNHFLLEFLVHRNDIVRLKALRCYAICCIFDKPSAQQGIHVFAVPIFAYQAGEECDTQTLITCISAVSDLIRVFGADLMAEPHEDQLSESVNEEHQKVFAGGTSLTSLVQGLVDLMDNEQYDIRLKASEGLCKLILDERIHSSSLISRLVLKWCHPSDEEESESQSLKQFIGHVLGKLPYLANSSEQLEGAVLLTVNTLFKAPKNSPLGEVDIDNIAKFMLSLCKVSPKGKQIHCNIAFSLCKKINNNPDDKINSTYSKMLLMLDLPEGNDFIEELFTLVEEAKEYINEKVALKNLTKYLSTLSEILRGNKEVVEELSDVTEENEEMEQMD